MRYKKLKLTKDVLSNFIASGMTAEEICFRVGCCRGTVRDSMRRCDFTEFPKGFWTRHGKKVGRPVGIPCSEKQKKNTSEKMRGEGNPFYGKKHTKKTRQKMRENHADFSGDNNPYKKSLEDPKKLEEAKQRGKDRWKDVSLEDRVEWGRKTRRGFAEISGSFWARIKSGAKARDLELSVTPEEAWNVYINQNKKCAFSGVDIKFGEFYEETTASLDRIDSFVGYTIKNICWVHKRINLMKGVLSVKDFIFWCKQVSKYNGDNHGKKISTLIR